MSKFLKLEEMQDLVDLSLRRAGPSSFSTDRGTALLA
jgi:hypothetical protein